MRALVLTVLVLLAGCGALGGSDAEDTLRAYLEALVEGDPARAYALLSGADRAARTPAAWRVAAPRYARFRIVRVHEYEDLATAQVEVVPAAAGVAAQTRAVLGSAPERPQEDPPAQAQSFTLVREGGQWKVYLGQGGSVAAGVVPPAPAAPARSAALPGPTQATRQGSPAAPERSGTVAAQRDSVVLYDLKARYYRSYSGRSVPGVEFKLRNRADRPVTRVVVTVYFLDAAGTPIWEEQYFPVRTDPDGFLSTPPLKPGYIWQVERGKFLLAESVPEEWKAGAVRAEITEVQFEDPAAPS